MMSKSYELGGQSFGKLVVLLVPMAATRHKIWRCKCECGNYRDDCSNKLVSGIVTKCKECSKCRKHGGYGTKEYRAWIAAKKRCYNPNYEYYERYGGRGITMSDEWRSDFGLFLLDMGLAPSDKHTLERKNIDGNYCKENCVWATMTEQNNNRSNTRMVEYNGFSVPFSSVADLHNMHRANAFAAHFSGGMPLETVIERYANTR